MASVKWNGRRASMLPSFAGLIRRGEISSGRIPHALAVQMSKSLLTQQAMWPAYAFDRNSGYTGTLPMGALLAIPSWVNVDQLPLTATGKVIAHAAQDYGIYVVDRNGGGGMTMLAQLGDPEIRWSGDWSDLSTVTKNLQWVTNNSPTSVGGGGTPRAPLAPAFYDDPATTSTSTSTTVPALHITSTKVSSITRRSAVVTWTTDQSSTGSVAYGTTPLLGRSVSASAVATTHSLTLSGLTRRTTYYFVVTATSSGGSLANTATVSFKTAT